MDRFSDLWIHEAMSGSLPDSFAAYGEMDSFHWGHYCGSRSPNEGIPAPGLENPFLDFDRGLAWNAGFDHGQRAS